MMPLADDRAATACIELQSPEQDLPDYCINICTILDDSGHMTTIGSFVGSSSSWEKKKILYSYRLQLFYWFSSAPEMKKW